MTDDDPEVRAYKEGFDHGYHKGFEDGRETALEPTPKPDPYTLPSIPPWMLEAQRKEAEYLGLIPRPSSG